MLYADEIDFANLGNINAPEAVQPAVMPQGAMPDYTEAKKACACARRKQMEKSDKMARLYMMLQFAVAVLSLIVMVKTLEKIK